jgi:effector-binding domain-containing protein
MATEEPKFSLAQKDGAFEVRDYPDLIVAEVTVTGTQQEASQTGFRKLAGYIFGGNTGAKRIAMTTPVTKARIDETPGQRIAMTAPVTQIGTKGDWVVRFTMPAELVFADLPRPNDPDVMLKALPAARYAVLTFSGLSGEAKVASETKKLLSKAMAHGLSTNGPVSQARYNPPWTPWFMRRNEVMIPVSLTGSEPA